MLQQTPAEKHHSKLSFLDGLSQVHADRKEIERDIDYLKQDYSSSLRIAANLSSHGKWIPYPFLANRLKGVADVVRTQAEAFRQKVVELGGALPQVSVDAREEVDFRQNVRRLVKDMEEYNSFSEFLVHQKNNVRNPVVAAMLDGVASGLQNKKDELLDIVMRLS